MWLVISKPGWSTEFSGELKQKQKHFPLGPQAAEIQFGSGPRKLSFWTLPGASAVEPDLVTPVIDSRS